MKPSAPQAPSLIPRFRKLYLCRYGWNGGKQICLFLGYLEEGYAVRKWLAKSGRWTNKVVIRQQDLIAKATALDCKQVQVDVRKL